MRRFFIGSLTSIDNILNQVPFETLDEVPHEQHVNDTIALSSLKSERIITLPVDVHHHWCRVLRAKVGDQSVFFDGLGGETQVELIAIGKKSATAKILLHTAVDRLPPYLTTIAIVMSRGDKLDYAIQKSTELGVTAIQLLSSHHGEVHLKPQQVAKKLSHWQQVAISACEQCGLNRPPLVLSPLAIESWLNGEQGYTTPPMTYLSDDSFYQNYNKALPLKLVLAVPSQTEHNNDKISESFKAYKTLTMPNNVFSRFDILIGPEGGLSDSEYKLARHQNYLTWQLGNRILRTETAPVVALTLLNLSSF